MHSLQETKAYLFLETVDFHLLSKAAVDGVTDDFGTVSRTAMVPPYRNETTVYLSSCPLDAIDAFNHQLVLWDFVPFPLLPAYQALYLLLFPSFQR